MPPTPPTVPSRRIVVISHDQHLARQLAAALEPLGAPVAVHPALDAIDPAELQAALSVLHVANEGDIRHVAQHLSQLPGLAQLAGSEQAGQPSGAMIIVAPRASLAAIVALMQASEAVAGVIIADDFEPTSLAAMASRILRDDVLGVDTLLAPGTQIQSQTIGDHAAKARCMAAIAAFVEKAGAAANYRVSIEQCIDEMMMNALYDAPVDADGTHIFAGTSPRVRSTMRTRQTVAVHYASDGTQLVVSVRDAFGSLSRDTVLRHLHKGVHAEDQVDQKAGGAGLGLFLMASAATAVYFHVLPGIATEAICVFALEPAKQRLAQLGFLVQRDPRGRTPTGPARRIVVLTPRDKLLRVATLALSAAVVTGAIIAWPRIFASHRATLIFTTTPSGATIELAGRAIGSTGGSTTGGSTTGGSTAVGSATSGTLTLRDLEADRDYAVVARLDRYEPRYAVIRTHRGDNPLAFDLKPLTTVELDTLPTDATVVIDGKPMGSTPLALTSLAPGTSVSIVFTRPGYATATARFEVPALGHRKRLVQPLEASPDAVRVRFVSTPSGAEILRDGEKSRIDRTYTPAEIVVEAGHEQRFTLAMPKHKPLVIAPFTPARGDQVVEKGGELIPE